MFVEVRIEGLHILCYAAVSVFKIGALLPAPSDATVLRQNNREHKRVMYERWNFNSGNYLFTTDTK